MTSLQHRASPPSFSAQLEPLLHLPHEAAQQMSVPSLGMPFRQNHSGSDGANGGGGWGGHGGEGGAGDDGEPECGDGGESEELAKGGGSDVSVATPTQPTSAPLWHGLPALSMTSLQHSSSPPSRSAHFEPPEHFSHEAAQQVSVPSLGTPLWQNHSGSGGGGGGKGGCGDEGDGTMYGDGGDCGERGEGFVEAIGGGDGGELSTFIPTQPTSALLWHGLPVLLMTSLQHSSSPPSRSAHFVPPEHFSHEAAQQMSVSSLRIPL